MANKRTPLYDRHQQLDARIVDFSGWDMPVQYSTGILQEHTTTREAVGLFDTCHMGEFLFEGEDVRQGLNQALAGDFRKLKDNRERYTFITNEQGGVIDDAVVMIFSDTKAWMVVNAGDIEGDFEAICRHLPDRITATNRSDATGKLDVQGPKAHEVVRAVLGHEFRTMPFYSFGETEWQGQPVVLSRSGYTGEPGVELYIHADHVGALWDALLEAGKPHGLGPCGLGARDTLRLEAGLPLYGHELTPELNPVQAGFGKFVRLDKPEDFPGKQALAEAREALDAGTIDLEVLAGLRMASRRTPRTGFAVLKDSQSIGRVTSGAIGPSVGATLALAYLRHDASEAGTPVAVEIRGKPADATVASLPFYANPAIRERIADA